MLDWFTEFTTTFSWLNYGLETGLMVLAAWIARHFVMGWLRRRARREGSAALAETVNVLDGAIVAVLIVAVAAAALNLFPLRPRLLAVLNRFVYGALLIVLVYYASRAFQILLNQWLSRTEGEEAARAPIRFLARTVFVIFAVMLVLENLGISLTALWTTLGVGSVAVALALQDTLSNFFGGLYLQLDRPVRIGDYVKLGSGEEGFVTQVGWRSTRIRTLPNNVVVIPNSKLATQVITNFSLPAEEMSLLIPVAVGYDCDPDEVERILTEEAMSAAGNVPGLLPEPAPFVRLIPGFGESALNFTLICRVSTYVDQYLVQHELRKRILARFRREGIQIPFPQRDIHLSGPAAALPGNGPDRYSQTPAPR